MKAIRCEGLQKSYGGVHALQDVGLEFLPPGITAIIGPNGAGKTTLLNVLTGFLRPDAGRIFFGEREITYLPSYRIARLGIARTFQDLRLITQVSVLDNILLVRPNQRGESLLRAIFRIGVSAEEARNQQESIRLLRFVGLEEKSMELVGELSYGEQKLLTLAVCLATEARILFLDEPVAGVYPLMRERILGLLSELRDQGKLLVFIEHDLRAVREVADNVIAMEEGRVIAQGPPGEVLERSQILEAYVG